MKKPRGMRAAINAMCKDCIYDDAEKGAWRQQVERCDIQECPLWPLRPRSKTKVEEPVT
jgi:hypothetical protein